VGHGRPNVGARQRGRPKTPDCSTWARWGRLTR
jgi:DNA primase large subunit